LPYYPIYLNITNKRCVIVGGGEVGERKAERLLACGAKVAVVNRELSPSLKRMKNAGEIEHIDADYDAAYLDGALMVIGATNNEQVNGNISGDARARGILVNIVDDPERCDFILPSLVQQGDLTIAVSTGGKSPALAKKIREELELSYGPEYAVLLDIMGELRRQAQAKGAPSGENKKMFEAVVNSDILCRIKAGIGEEVKRKIREITGLEVASTGKEARRGKG